MSYFILEGGHALKGEITPQGAKNEALQVLCAVLLTDETVQIENVPEILDVLRLIEILKEMGVEVTRLDEGTYQFKAANIDFKYLQTKEFISASASIRASIMLLGPLLGRFGKAFTSRPGGDKIGRRP
ncbi:MAG TPA: UDP-N-acetylglucosamine 1-carboxyvinyltransferase, partial [Bacteroidales bacterium]|nr:UDP-N-acetylglucosamine 1-carboxyvinyltransferase [Bacteroidales bacterium]